MVSGLGFYFWGSRGDGEGKEVRKGEWRVKPLGMGHSCVHLASG